LAWVVACVTMLPAPVAEKLAVADTGMVIVPGPMKSVSGRYGVRKAVLDAVTPSCVAPDVPPKSNDPSYAEKL
jgi:hypothetical protein